MDTADNNTILASMALRSSLLPDAEVRSIYDSLTAEDDQMLASVPPEKWPQILRQKVAKLLPPEGLPPLQQ